MVDLSNVGKREETIYEKAKEYFSGSSEEDDLYGSSDDCDMFGNSFVFDMKKEQKKRNRPISSEVEKSNKPICSEVEQLFHINEDELPF